MGHFSCAVVYFVTTAPDVAWIEFQKDAAGGMITSRGVMFVYADVLMGLEAAPREWTRLQHRRTVKSGSGNCAFGGGRSLRLASTKP